MASADELRPPELGDSGGDVRRDRVVQGVSEEQGSAQSGGAAEIEVGDGSTALGYVLTKEPPSGMYVRGRFANHHTAAVVWHRDDAEGHDDGRWWWFHEGRKWVSWKDIVWFAGDHPAGEMVLEPLFSPPSLPGCAPYGMHDGRCLNPDIENFK